MNGSISVLFLNDIDLNYRVFERELNNIEDDYDKLANVFLRNVKFIIYCC